MVNFIIFSFNFHCKALRIVSGYHFREIAEVLFAGLLVGQILYCFTSSLPRRRKQKALKTTFNRLYQKFKENILWEIIGIIQPQEYDLFPVSYDLIQSGYGIQIGTLYYTFDNSNNFYYCFKNEGIIKRGQISLNEEEIGILLSELKEVDKKHVGSLQKNKRSHLVKLILGGTYIRLILPKEIYDAARNIKIANKLLTNEDIFERFKSQMTVSSESAINSRDNIVKLIENFKERLNSLTMESESDIFTKKLNEVISWFDDVIISLTEYSGNIFNTDNIKSFINFSDTILTGYNIADPENLKDRIAEIIELI